MKNRSTNFPILSAVTKMGLNSETGHKENFSFLVLKK